MVCFRGHRKENPQRLVELLMLIDQQMLFLLLFFWTISKAGKYRKLNFDGKDSECNNVSVLVSLQNPFLSGPFLVNSHWLTAVTP